MATVYLFMIPGKTNQRNVPCPKTLNHCRSARARGIMQVLNLFSSPEHKVLKVLVMVGSDKGKIGLIQKVIKERNWVFVAGLNRKRDPLNPKGEIKEAPLLYPNEVKLVDPSDMQQTEIEWRYTEEGDQVRVSTRTGRLIPLSAKAAATWEDGVDQNKYSESPQDTSMAALKEVTFTPVNSTFEEDLLRKFDEYEPKKKRKTYWY